RIITTDWHMRRAQYELSRQIDPSVRIVPDAVRSHPSLTVLFREYHKFALRRIADRMGRRDEAQAFLATYEERLSALEEKARTRRLRPVYLASPLLDGRHVILYGRNSLFDDVLRGIGMRNAFDGQSSPWGVASMGVDRLAAEREAVFVYIESPVTQAALKALNASAIWKTLPFVKEGRVVSIPYLEMYGALPTAYRFAGILESLLDRGALDAG
ncbi:MAG: ABC transporter substrate-binding protein, partial [Rhizobiales bacterium]|nr:ABC transporter substrate-binding protein [Hyphomicrobiales bacterium]